MSKYYAIILVFAVAVAACDSGFHTDGIDDGVEVLGKQDLPDGVVYNEHNGNYYQAVEAVGITWDDANEAASGLRIGQCESHLAAITSQEENDWIAATFPLAAENGYWLGGRQADDAAGPADGWSWITGETWLYTNWKVDEPNDFEGLVEQSLHFAPTLFTGGDGTWNDIAFDDVVQFDGGYVVEYECRRSVTGGGRLILEDFGDVAENYGFNAHKGADASVKGQAEIHSGGTNIHIDVTCLSIWDNNAWLGGVTTRSNNDDFPAGLEYWWRVEDNGQGAGADSDGQGFLFYFTNGAPIAHFCALQQDENNFPSAGVLLEWDHGNVKIH